MKTATRPQYHRLQRILELIRQGTRSGTVPNCREFMGELEVSRRTLMRDLDFLRDDCRAPIAYDESRKGFRLNVRHAASMRRQQPSQRCGAGGSLCG
jgi:predicted DNA-binding transcriptional regulator YafY